MKKILLALIVVCSVGSVTAQSKVAHVNSQVLLDTMPSRKSAIVKLQDFEAAGRNELQEMNADFEKSYNVFMANQSTWSPVILKIEEEKLMKKQQNLQEREQSLQQEMQVYSQELNNPILEMVQKAVKEVSEKNKINYVIDESVTMYFAGGTDITKEVITVLLRMDQQ